MIPTLSVVKPPVYELQVKQRKIGVSTLSAKLTEHIDKIDTDLVSSEHAYHEPAEHKTVGE